MAYVFAPPAPAHRTRSVEAHPIQRKRKRRHTTNSNDHPSGTVEDDQDVRQQEDYGAVLSPDERNQRRAARYSLIEPVPLPPFPHGATSQRNDYAAFDRRHELPQDPDARGQSLRVQHLAALSAVLHKCILNKDYIRAGRALGLLLRSEVAGQTVDIRTGGNWAIAAEVLFKQLSYNTEGFQQARVLYEKLVIQHPFHKSAKESINAVNFYLAMFNLWIFTVQKEQESGREGASNFLTGEPSSQIQHHHQQCKEIARSMDTCMNTAPFSDNEHLLYLRANVALWEAHLNEQYQQSLQEDREIAGPLASSTPQTLDAFEQMNIIDSHTDNDRRDLLEEYREARELAEKILRRLGKWSHLEDLND